MQRARAVVVLASLTCLGPSTLAVDVLSVGYGEGAPGARRVSVAVTARHDLPIHGFSLALTYPRAALRLLEISPAGTATAQIGTEFFKGDLDEAAGTAVLGVIFSFHDPYQPVALPPTAPDDRPQLIAWLIFDVLAGAGSGEQRIQLVNGLGTPPVSNRFTYQGTTIRPALENGVVVVRDQVDNVVTIDWKAAQPGFRITEPFYAYARHPLPLQGYSLAVTFDPRALTLEEFTYAGTSVFQLLGEKKIEFKDLKYQLADIQKSPGEARATAALVFDYLAPFDDTQALPPETSSSTRQTLLRMRFQPKEGATQYGEYQPLSLADSPAPDAVNNTFVVGGGRSLLPRKVDGRIYFSTGFIAGSVVNYVTGAPLGGATLSTDPMSYSASSGADGRFTVGGAAGVPAGPYSLVASRSGYFPARIQVSLPGLGETVQTGVIALFPVPPSVGGFRRGLVNGDESVDISDGISILGYLFQGGASLPCLEAADANDDATLDLSDAVTIFGYLFLGSAPPPSPFASCGPDPTPDDLGCSQPPPGC